jgi:glycosyltransferase involved in cell wall biosynthesis
LESLCDPQVLDEIEVLIVNDGSADNTPEIAEEYVNRHASFQLINKENGGHGSGINCAAPLAKGKYLKVLDSDDEVENLRQYVLSLRKADADVVLTHFNAVDLRTNFVRPYKMANVNFGQTYTFEDFWLHKKDVRSALSLHGITYKTSFYQSCNIHLTERISYEDQEFATLPFAKVKTILPLDISLYIYYLGYPGQSVADANQVKNLHHMETVLWKIMDETPANSSPTVKGYFLFKMCGILLIYYMATLIRNPNKKEGRAQAKAIRSQVRTRQPALHAASRKQYFMCNLLSVCGIRGNTLVKLQMSGIYRFFTRLAH